MDWRDLLEELISLVETAAPKLWEIAIRQVYVEAIRNAVWVVFAAIFVVVCWRLLKYFSKHQGQDLFDGWEIDKLEPALSVFGLTISLLILVYNTNELISKLINPAYYAIEILISYVR